MHDTVDNRLLIRELIENWAVWRDTGQWDRLRGLWHADGQMWATWFRGSADEFVRVSREAHGRGMRVVHALGGMTIDLAGERALAQTRMTVTQRAPVDGVLCDVVCTGRFYDFLDRRGGRWGIALRRLVYEQDRLDPVDPAAKLVLDTELLARFPDGYRHLAYVQTKMGLAVSTELPGHAGPELEALYAQGAAWLAA